MLRYEVPGESGGLREMSVPWRSVIQAIRSAVNLRILSCWRRLMSAGWF